MKPMLAGKADLEKVVYPVLVSPKLDGVRALRINGGLLSRSLKPIPNAHVQSLFSALPDGVDGELILGDPTAKDAYRQTVSSVMRQDGKPNVTFFIFDNFRSASGFRDRFRTLEGLVGGNVQLVPHKLVHNLEELIAFEADLLAQGFEGVMIRSLDGPYKQGRSSTKEGYLLKVKRFVDMDARITGSVAWEHNANIATTNALGRTERSSHKDGKIALDILGKFEVVGLEEPFLNVAFEVGTGFDGADSEDGERAKLWQKRKSLVGKIIKVKYFPTGSKDKPRHPVFLGFRDEMDRS